MGMVRPSGTAFLATTSTRKKVASSKKEAKKPAKRKKSQLKDEYEREELSKEFEGSSEGQIDKASTFADSNSTKKARMDDWSIEDQRGMIAADEGKLNAKIEGQFSSSNKLPRTLRGRNG